MDKRDHMDSERWWEGISPNRTKVTLRFDIPSGELACDEDDDSDFENRGPDWYYIEWVVCGGCEGRGQYVNPSIDSHGLTREDFDQDPEFHEDYVSGVYNIPCDLCKGRSVVPEFSSEWYDITTLAMLKDAREGFLNEMHFSDQENYMERMFGA